MGNLLSKIVQRVTKSPHTMHIAESGKPTGVRDHDDSAMQTDHNATRDNTHVEDSQLEDDLAELPLEDDKKAQQLPKTKPRHVKSSLSGSTSRGSSPRSERSSSDEDTVADSTDHSDFSNAKFVTLSSISEVISNATLAQRRLDRVRRDSLDKELKVHEIDRDYSPEDSEALVPISQAPEGSQEKSEDFIKRITKPEYPIRVYDGPPTSISEEAQRRVFRWRYSMWEEESRAIWLVEPNIEHLQEVVTPYLQRIVPECQDFEIEYLTEGGFNKVYTATPIGPVVQKAFIIRVALPSDPYYRVESDVATMELVRCSTSIPVPIIYAYESSANNKLGLEWMLMEKIGGKELHEAWLDWDYDAKLRLTKTVALWTNQLLQIKSDKIGSVYMRSVREYVEFYVGRSTRCYVSGNRRLWYGVPRGPYGSLEDYFGACLAFHENETLDHMRRACQKKLGTAAKSNGLLTPPRSDDSMEDQHPNHSQPRAEESLYAQADKDDAEYYNWQELTAEDFRQRLRKWEVLKDALPQLCSRAAEDIPHLSTTLRHHDISVSNIFIDKSGKPIALIDWEHTQLEPLACTYLFPDFLETEPREEIPSPPDEEAYSRLLARGWTQEEVDEQKGPDQRSYLEKLNDYHCTKLRDEFKQELEKLMPSLDPMAWPESESFLRDLNEQINDMDTEDYEEWLMEWVGNKSKGDESEDTDHVMGVA